MGNPKQTPIQKLNGERVKHKKEGELVSLRDPGGTGFGIYRINRKERHELYLTHISGNQCIFPGDTIGGRRVMKAPHVERHAVPHKIMRSIKAEDTFEELLLSESLHTAIKDEEKARNLAEIV